MKHKSLLMALVILLPAAAAGAEIVNKDGNKLDLYGQLNGVHYFSSDADNNGDRSYTRFGFKGETQIADGLTGYGQWEYQAGLDQAESAGPGDSYTRLGFAGLTFGRWGSLDYGRNYGLLYDVAGWTDVLPEFGNDSYEAADNFMTGRANGLLTYHNRSLGGLLDGLDLGLQYQGKNRGDDALRAKDIQTQNGDGYAFSATYDTGAGLNFGAAYANSARTLAQQRFGLADGDRARAWTLGLKYDLDNLYLAASYARTENMTYVDGDRYAGFAPRADAVEAVAQYHFDSGVTPSVAYLQTRGRNLPGFGDADLVKYLDLALNYSFNANMSTYVEYKLNLLQRQNAVGAGADDIVETGIMYQF
ncbi:porin [Serratia ureilytica]|uniref:porin n=1 Tax=Serratia ureilytica TaxID=300181 RepID=UPI0018D8540C|nr:porin [Serratia ureilytica]MBH3008379.1 porin [Serratia ureilytica]